ncbi:outer membrane beta-barrel protein, partial [bacterium]|nr:outer membrane beta-barrel protein [bacterium]
MRFLGIFLIAFCANVLAVQAQSRFQTTFSFSMGFPQGEFGDNVDNTGLGLNAGLNYRIGHSPVLIGVSFGFLQYGSVSRSALLSPDIPELIVDVQTSNNILATHFLARYEFLRYESRIRPYVEGLVGLHYLWTQTSIDDSDDEIS